jgi:hypothetical protein
VDLSQVTIANNIASGSGGGIAVELSVATSIHNSTIAGNKAAIGGGLFVLLDESNDPVEVISTIIGNNLAGGDKDASGPITAPSSLIGGNPLLSPLAFHGGTTQVMVPLKNSPALDAGDNPDNLTLDQRGTGVDKLGNPVSFSRVLGSQIDIGAVEFPAANVVAASATSAISVPIVIITADFKPLPVVEAIPTLDSGSVMTAASASFSLGCSATLVQASSLSISYGAITSALLSQGGTLHLTPPLPSSPPVDAGTFSDGTSVVISSQEISVVNG